MNYLFVRECLYSVYETVIILIIVSIVKEFKRFRGNFHSSITAMEVTLFGSMLHNS